MNSVLVGGLSRGMASALERYLGGAAVHLADTAGQVLERIASHGCDLLILGHDLPGVGAAEVVRRLTEGAASSAVPVVYCQGPDPVENGDLKHIARLGVSRILPHPLTTDSLLACVAELLSAGATSAGHGSVLRSVEAHAVASAAVHAAPPRVQDVPAADADTATEPFAGSVIRRLDLLERTAVSLLDGTPESSLDPVRTEAENLSALLMSLGRPEAARVARDIEEEFDSGGTPERVNALRLSELIVELRAELDRPLAVAESEGLGDTRPLLLTFTDRPEFADGVAMEAGARGLRCRAVTAAADVLTSLTREMPAVVLIDCESSAEAGGRLSLLGEIAELAPLTPVLVAASVASLANRVAVARAGGHALLRKPLSPAAAVDAVFAAIRRADVAGCRVLAVDDDAVAMADLRQRLERLRIEMTSLSDARLFSESIETVRPDVILLAMNTRHYSGPDLCRVVRGDDRWLSLPVMIMGDAADPAAVHLAFLAGADDFIPRPLVAQEIATRILNRLERFRIAQDRGGTDPLTGLVTRSRSEHLLQSLLRLSRRCGKPFSLGVINVDGMRDVNGTCGNATGDAVLRRLARLLRNSFRLEDVVTRWEGDQFVLGAFGFEKDDCVRRLQHIAERLRRDAFRAGELEMNVGFSAGVSCLYSDGTDLPALRHAAEDALAFAKSLGGARVLPTGWLPDRRTVTETVNVALVESDEPLADLLLHTLQQEGWTSRWIRTADEAAELLCGSYPRLRAQVVLLEIDLPGRDGFSVLHALARDGVLGRSRVIVLTARAHEAEVVESFELGAIDHVAKPFSMPVLLQRIRRTIRGGL